MANLTVYTRIIFGDRVDDVEEPKANRRDRLRQLEAKQREKEGLPELRIRGQPVPPAATSPVLRPPGVSTIRVNTLTSQGVY